ncbi:MAG: WD40/YVTN/BNR-like repeat-containing protein [Lachnospira sp.]
MLKISDRHKKIASVVAIGLLCVIVVAIYAYSDYRSRMQKKIVLKSRYTFNVTIDCQGNVLADGESFSASYGDASDFSDFKNTDLAKIWINEYTKQYMSDFVPYNSAIRKVTVESINQIPGDTNAVFLSFSAELRNPSTEYFADWDGFIDNGKLNCGWVINIYLDNHYDNTATIYVTSVMSSEEYGIAQSAGNQNSQVTGDKESIVSNDKIDPFAGYSIRDNILYVTYDGGEKYIPVPIDVDKLPYSDDSNTELKDGSFMITAEKTAFLYGATGGKKSVGTPLMLIYSDDTGSNWITCEIEDIYDADYYYVDFFENDTGVIVCGYSKSNDSRESSAIFMTKNGGETWNSVGSGPANYIIEDVVFVNTRIGFFCYKYEDKMESNLYKTMDGGKTFSKVVLEEQELDSSAAASAGSNSGTALGWFDVYKEALIPIVGQDGTLTLYLTQGENGVYNDGKTAAKYQSNDNGYTWKYIGQMEISIK